MHWMENTKLILRATNPENFSSIGEILLKDLFSKPKGFEKTSFQPAT